MASSEPTIIISKLDDKELQASIDKLVSDVADKSQEMAGKFESAMDKMKSSMKDFAITQKVSVDLMKEAWRDMSKSFDAMFKAMSGAGGSGASGSGKGGAMSGASTTTSASAPNTIGELKEQVHLQGQIVDQQVRGTRELQQAVNLHEKLKNDLKEETKSQAQARLQRGLDLQPKGLEETKRALQYLQTVQRRYANTTQLSAQEQRNLANAITRTQREIAKINNTRPKTLKEVLGMDESSVDAITRKMRELKRVQLDTSDATQVKNLASKYQELTNKRREMLGQNALLEQSNLSLARSFGYIRNRLVYAFTIGAVLNFTKELIRVRAEYEMLDRSLGILIGDMEKGTQIFNELNEMALKSPFTLIELGTAAKQLTAYNFAANEVVDTTRRLADISAALGVPMERLTYNLGQIKAQGVLNARDARDFANAGLAIVPMLAQLYTKQKRFGDEIVTTAQVYDMMSKKMVSYGDVLHVLTDITDEGGKFFDFQAKQADTLKVQLANLTLAWNNMLNEIGTDNQGIISGALGMLRDLAQNWKTVKNAILTVVTALGAYKGAMVLAYLWSKRMALSGAIEAFIGLAKSIKTAKDAVLLFNMVCKASPLGILVSLLATAGVAFLTFGDDVEEASENVNMFGENASKQINKVESLTKVLKAVKQGTNTYKNALGELNQIAQEYGIEEIKTLDELIVKREHLIELIQREGAERTYANNIAKSQEKYDKGVESTINELRTALQENYSEAEADAYSTIIEDILTRNIDLIVGKSGKELDKGFREIQEKIKEGLRNAGLSDLEINVLFHTNQSDINKAQNGILILRNEQTQYNATIEKYYNNSKKATKSTMDWQERLRANQKALQDVSKDAMALYNRMYEMVELAQRNKNNDIRFNLKLVADEPPAWMSKMPIKKLRELAVRFGALAQSGTRVKGHQDDADYAYMRYVQYTSAYRTAQEKAAQDNNKTTKTRTKQTDEFAKAIKEVGNAMTNTRKKQQELLKEGFDGTTILNSISENYGKTIELNNKKLQSFGVKGLKTATDFAQMGQREQKSYLVSLLDVAKLRGSAEAIEYLEGKLADLNEEILKTDNKTLIDSLKSGLDRLKDEYEIGIELDANPEMGSLFADMWGINMDTLPRTAKEYASRMTTEVNKYLGNAKSGIELPNLLNVTDDDLRAFEQMVKDEKLSKAVYDTIVNNVKDAREAYKKETEGIAKDWNSLVDKFGTISAKLINISKETASEYLSVIKKFGDNEQVKKALALSDDIKLETDPEKLKQQVNEMLNILSGIQIKKPEAIDITNAITQGKQSKTSKAYWEDFKNSDMYAMVFEDMANNSTMAIEMIIAKLEELKNKVKDDPASMKALMKSLEDARGKLLERDPFNGIANSIRNWAKASKEAKVADEELAQAQDRLEQAQGRLEQAQNKVDVAKENGDTKALAEAELELAVAKQEVAGTTQDEQQASSKSVEAHNKMRKALAQAKTAVNALGTQLNTVSGAMGGVADLFAQFGDEETAENIREINKGFQAMETVISLVNAVLVILESSNPWLLAIAAALSIIVGLVSFLSGNANKKITEQVEDSERAVKRLELAYIDLEHAVNEAYGMATIGANMAAKANKELQLVELKRQLALERSRDSKNRDEDKIIDLQKQIKELEYDIEDASNNIINDLLGISSVGDAMENMMDAFIEALRSGEDAMATFDESVDEMIANMVKKMFTTKILQPWFEEQWGKIQKQVEQRAGKVPDELAKVQARVANAKGADMNNDSSLVNALRALGWSDAQIDNLIHPDSQKLIYTDEEMRERTQRLREAYRKSFDEATQKEAELQKQLTTVTMPTTDDIRQYAELLRSGQPILEENMQEVANFLRELGLMKDDADKNLSALQQGIQGVSETTASAIEAYLNGMSQQAYLRNDILVQIRDAVVAIDSDVQTSTQAEMLLQLQNNYIIMQSIQSMMENWTIPSGQGIRVEMI